MPADSAPDLLLTTYRPDLDLLVSRWGYQPDARLLPPAYVHLTRDALAAGCRFWLQDIRRRALNDPEITRWLLTEYFPDMARQLGGRLLIAYLASPALLAAIQSGPGYVLPEAYSGRPFAVAFFGDEGAAIRWLDQQRS